MIHVNTALMQRENESEPWANITFYRMTFNQAQQKCSTFDWELLSNVQGMKKIL